MKRIGIPAFVLVLILCMTPVLAESGSSRIDELAGGIVDEIWFGKAPEDMMIVWMDNYTVAEWEEAAVKAVKEYRELEEKGEAFMTMSFDWEAYLDGSFFESAEYLSILEKYDLDRADSASVRDLGDESVPLYALCAMAFAALAGAAAANRKRVRA